ncbi:DBIRD complex subunit ZNF326 isoform X2 [Protopterus annectens]|uniref:DBIRD complex subunit ZNF326 isoform X2 n=1 Tax=Protopterus annectens TaxID=7888 RepID=UPI001CFB428A|nr:DBIRD complex subunit ZNF326 isoform X2 [Protopterus annectens]
MHSAMSRDYGHGSFGGPRGGSYDPPFGMEGGGRFGPYESYDSRSSMGGRDLYRSGYEFSEPEQSRFGGSYGDRYDNSYRQSVDSFGGRNQGGSSWDSSFSRSNMRPGAFDDGGRDSYSSFGNFPSPHMKPAPVGSRGRGPSAFPESAFGGRNFDALGGPPAGRGRGRGSMGYPSSMRARGIVVDYKNRGPQPLVGRGGIKRKFGPAAVAAGKKTKLSQGGTAATKAENDEEEEKKRIEARREKQRRRREKNSEKYGDGYRMAYTCSFCKFRSFEEKDIVEHLDSETHQATLDHIQKQTKFEKVVMEFLHACMVNKYKKTSLRKVQAQTPQNEDGKPQEKDVMEGVTPEDHMIKVDTVHCSPCNAYIPALPSSVQQHLRSADHTKNKREYKEQIKRESVLTATSILNNPIVKTRFEMFAKGENPFENPEQTEQQADGEAQADADGEGEAEEADEALEEGDGEEDEGGEAAANDVDQFTTDDVDQSFEN